MITVKYLNPHCERYEEYTLYTTAEYLITVMQGLLLSGCIINSVEN